MPSRPRHILLTGMTLITLLLISVIASFAESINYVYDDLNRLIQVQYENGSKIEYTYDEVGNRLLKQISDTGAPVTTASPLGGIYYSTQSVTLTCNDGSGSGCDKIYYTTDGTTPTTASSVFSFPISIAATTTLKYFAIDRNGNIEPVKSQTYTFGVIDTTPPTGTVSINAGAAYTKTTASTLSLSCTDNAGACDQMQFSSDNTNWLTPEAYAASKAWTLTTGDGTKNVYVKFKDPAGNWSTTISDAIVLDTTAPVTTALPAGGTYKTTKSVSLTCGDGTGAGCDKIFYTTNGTNPTTTSSVYSGAISIAANTTLKYFATDLTGNIETVKSQAYIIDTIPPVTTASLMEGAYNTTQSVSLSCSDGTGTGCGNIYYTTDGSTPSTSSSVYSTPINIASTTVLRYFATDLAGNESAKVKQTYTIDTDPPTVARFFISSAGNTYTGSASVRLDISCSDGLYDCAQMQFSNDKVSWSPLEAYSGNKAWTLTAGDGTKTVYAKFRDAAGNWSATVSDTIVLETIAPVSTVSPAGGVYHPNLTVTLTCSDGGGAGCSKIIYTTDGTTPSQEVVIINGQQVSPTRVYSTPLNITTTTTLKYFAIDLVSNSEAVKTQTYTIVSSGPVTTASPAGGVYNSTQAVTLICNDGTGPGCDKIYFTTDGTTPTTSSNVYSAAISIGATTTLRYFATDVVGGIETAKTQTYVIETTPPTGTITINSGDNVTSREDVELTLSCTDNAGACNQMQFSNDNVSWSTPQAYATIRAWNLAYGDGTKTVYAKFKDTAGNWSTAFSDTIVLETLPPVTTASPIGGAYNTNQSVTLACSDGAGTGCDKIFYTKDGTTPTTSSSVYTGAITIALTTTLQYFSTDLAGNSEEEKSQTYTIDTTPPTGTIKINFGDNETNTTSGTLDLTCSDSVGCDQMQFSSDNVNWSAPEAYAAKKAWTLTTGDGTKIAYAKFRDKAGNWSIAFSDTIVLDTITPVTTASPSGGVFNATKSVTLTCSDGTGSGCDDIYYTTNGTTPTTSSSRYSDSDPISISSNATLKYFATDNAGNSEAVTSQTYTIETTVPVTTASPAGGTYNATQSVMLACSDGTGAGCDKIYYSTDGTTPTTSSSVYSGAITVASTQTIKYFATDLADNSETVKTQTYTIDTTPPTGTITINTGAAYTKTTAVTLTLSCTDNAGACSQMQFSNDNASWSTPEAYATTKAWIFATGDGIKTVYAKFKDTAGNWSTTVSDTIVLDSIAPSVTITSPAAATTTDNTPLLTYTASDGTVVVKVDGSIVNKVSGTSLDTLANGSHAVRVEATDAAGNIGFAEVTFTVSVVTGNEDFETGNLSNLPWVTSGNGLWAAKTTRVHGGAYAAEAPVSIRNDESATMEVTMDSAAGNISFWYSVSSEENDDELLFFIDGIQKLQSSGEVPWTQATFSVSAGSHMFKWVYSKDGISSDGADTAWVDDIDIPIGAGDITPPTGTISINSGASYTKTAAVTLTLSCTDNDSCVQMQFSNDNASWSSPEAYAATKAWTLTSGDGTKNVYVKFKDAAGNWSTAYGDAIGLDAIAPATTASPAGGNYTASQTVTLTCSDGAGAGCDKVYYTTDGTTPMTSSSIYSGAINVASNQTLKYFATDLAGNSETVKSQTYTITASDTTPPSGTITINSGATYTKTSTTTLSLSCTDNAGACSQMQFSNDNASWSTPEAYATAKAWTLASGDGTKTVYAKFKDAAGNWSSAVSDTIVLDTIAPSVTITSPAAGTTTDNTPLLTYTASDGTVVVKVDGSIVNKASGTSLDTLANGSHNVRVEATDAAGNIGFAEITFTVSASVTGSEDFETGNLSNLPWVTSGNGLWAVKSTKAHGGVYAAQAPSITTGQSAAMEVTMDCTAGSIDFWYSLNSLFDNLKFYIDGVQKLSKSGSVSWTQATYGVTAGMHTFKWVYSYSMITPAGSTAWVDDIIFPIP